MPGWHIACGTSQLLLNDLSKNGQVSRAELSSLVQLQHDHCFAGQRSLRVQTAKCTKQSTHASFFALFCGASEIQAAPWMTVCGWQDVKLQWPTLLVRFLRRHAWPQPCSVYCKLGRPDAPTLWLFRQAVPGRVALSGHLTFLSDTWRWYQTPDILHSRARVWMSSFNTQCHTAQLRQHHSLVTLCPQPQTFAWPSLVGIPLWRTLSPFYLTNFYKSKLLKEQQLIGLCQWLMSNSVTSTLCIGDTSIPYGTYRCCQ